MTPSEALGLAQSMGLTLPTPAYLFAALIFGLVGMVAFRRGRKTSHSALTWLGVALMLFPYGASSTWLLYGLGVALCAGVYATW